MANNKVQLSDGTVLLDLTGDTVTPETLMAGVIAHNAAGEPIVGTAVGIKLTGIAITTPPTKTAYNAGETFDPAGMVVTATYSNGAKLTSPAYTFSPAGALAADDTAITITYTELGVTKTATQAITVKATSTETWILNEATTLPPLTVINFSYNGTDYTQIISGEEEDTALGETTPYVIFVAAFGNNLTFTGDPGDTGMTWSPNTVLIFSESPTGNLLTWLQANATKQ